MAPIGIYPTPLAHVAELSTPSTAFWVKRDDLTNPIYGGNKARKLEAILQDAHAQGRTCLITAGSAGSHHVLATAILGRREGFSVRAALVAQPYTEQGVHALRAALAQGLEATALTSYGKLPMYLFAQRSKDTYFVQMGGSSPQGTRAYVDAARECAAQVRAGAMQEPDVTYVTLGTGGTAAGLALGFAIEGMRTRVVAVAVVDPPMLFERAMRVALRDAARRLRVSRDTLADALGRVTVDTRFLGPGYAHPTHAGRQAMERAHATPWFRVEPTYTAKTLAASLARVAEGNVRTLLFWHTYATAPLDELLVAAPDVLPPNLAALFVKR